MNALVLAALLASPARADDVGVWAQQVLVVDIDLRGTRTGPLLWLDLNERAWGASYLLAVRPAVGWDLSHGVSVLAGYGAVASQSGEAPWRLEHRAWEQAMYAGRVDRLALMGRARAEQRWREDVDTIGQRLRLAGRAGVDVVAGWGLFLFDEAFFRLTSDGFGDAGFDQNRLFTGVFHQAPSGVRVEVGYLGVVADKGDPDLSISHIAFTLLTVPLQVRPEEAPAP